MKTNIASSIILGTKLYRPPVPARHVHRPMLVDQLENSLDKSLVLVSAPAGYGKSTLVSCWLGGSKRPGAWLSLDENDNDLHQFLSYFVAAVQSVLPRELSKTQSLVESSNPVPQSIVAVNLVNEIEQFEQELTVVLDDIHLISEQAVHDFLSTLLCRPPRRLLLVLIGRRDPLFPITTLRAKGLMFELRMRDLRFTRAESVEFLRSVIATDMVESTTENLFKKTEGWITGLHLAALVIQEQDLSSTVLNLKGTTRYVAEYLINEVLEIQPPEIHSCLLKSSILNRFCGSLCDAVLDEHTSPNERTCGYAFLKILNDFNIFIIPLDDENHWFRYHHLFQNLLKHRMEQRYSAEEIAACHLRAAIWFQDQGIIEEALFHFQRGGDAEAAGRVVARYGHELIEKERTADLDRCLRQLPRDVIEHNPMLLIFQAWIDRIMIRVSRMSGALNRAEECLRSDPPEKPVCDALWGYLNAIRSFQRYLDLDYDEAMTCADRAITMIPHETPYLRSFAMVIQAAALQMTGDFAKAVSIMNTALADPVQNSYGHGIILSGLTRISLIEGDPFALGSAATRLLALSRVTRLANHRVWARLYMALSHYQLNETEAAAGYLASQMEDRFISYPHVVSDSSVILSLCHQHAGRFEKARDTAELLSTHAGEIRHAGILQGAEAFQAELALRQGRLGEAVAWARTFAPRQLQAHYFFYLPELTLAKVLIAEDTPISRKRSQEVLSHLERFSRKTHNRSVLIPVLSLQAIQLNRQADRSGACDTLVEAVSLAAPGGNIRQFLDLGPEVARLLEGLPKKDSAEVYIETILEAFTGDESASPRSPHSRSSRLASSHTFPIVPLTPRELDVLDLLVYRLQNKEIADKLCVSPTTIKTHLKHIYEKLRVDNRLEAVLKAKRIGLL